MSSKLNPTKCFMYNNKCHFDEINTLLLKRKEVPKEQKHKQYLYWI